MLSGRFSYRCSHSRYQYWKNRLIRQAELYTSLQYLSVNHFNPGTVHPLLRIKPNHDPVRQANRMAVKLKRVTGTYMLQSTRSAFNNVQVDPVCVLCKTSDETTKHLVLGCCVLDFLRKPILEVISALLKDAFNIYFDALDSEQQLQTILDFYVLIMATKKRQCRPCFRVTCRTSLQTIVLFSSYA